MTREEWQASVDPDAMLRFVTRYTTNSNLRLFAVACSVRIWGLIRDHRALRGIKIADRYARGRASLDELEAARALAEDACEDVDLAEWVAEARANFRLTIPYIHVQARRCATHAAMLTTVPYPASAHSGHILDVTMSSHRLAAAAEKYDAQAAAFERLGVRARGDLHDVISFVGDVAQAQERKAQAEILRRLVAYPSKDAGYVSRDQHEMRFIESSLAILLNRQRHPDRRIRTRPEILPRRRLPFVRESL